MIYSTLIALGLVATAAAVNLDTYTFDEYVRDFDLKYHPSEIAARQKMFSTELERVRAHNAKNLGWKETMTKFSIMTPSEKKIAFGRSKNHHKAQKLRNAKSLPDDFKMVSVDLLPRNVDWREKGVVSAVKDQGHCGSCWAFASTAVIESHVAIQTGKLFDLSVQQMAMCAPNPDSCGGTGGCNGATAELAFEYVTSSQGMFQEFQYSYASYYGQDYDCKVPDDAAVATINGYVTLPVNNYTALMNAVATVGPIAVSVDASSWSPYSGGIFNGCNQVNPDIDHAVVLMGYGEEDGNKYWLIRNSWSASWGEQGYIRIARFDTEEEICGSDITPQDGTACAGKTDPVRACGTCGVLFDSAYPLQAQTL